jgi:D-alanine-D-alanine ligase
MNKNIHVAVIFNNPTRQTNTGRKFLSEEEMMQNAEHLYREAIDVSEVGVLEEREDVANALHELGFRTSLFNASDDVQALLKFLSEEQPNLIFNLVEGLGENAIHEIHVAGMYELLGIPYTGSAPVTLGLCLNKIRTKEILSYHHIPTPNFFLCENNNQCNFHGVPLQFPLIVKPSREDASIGIENHSIVESFVDLKKQIAYVNTTFHQAAIVEEYIDGRELNVAVIGNAEPTALPISEIDFSELPTGFPNIVTYNAKWMKGTPEYDGTNGKCPAELLPEVEQRVKTIALQAYKILECRDYARVDIRLTKENKPFVLEVNPNPDICDEAGFMRSVRTAGFSYTEIIGKIVSYAFERAQ